MPKLIAWTVAALCAAVVLALGANIARHAAGWSTTLEPSAERAARLGAHWRIVPAEGPERGGAILLSGCDGVRDNMAHWAGVFARHGRTAMIVDSHTPRGLSRFELWRLVCTGQALPGGERAGDVAVAIDALWQLSGSEGDIVLFGASHGGWSVMEFVALARAGTGPPPGLSDWPVPPAALLARVSSLVLLYPYCGAMNGADAARWVGAPPTLMVLAEEDSIVDTASCLARADAFAAAGATVETAVIEGADHGFDQREKSPLSTLGFDAQQRDAATGIVDAFLAGDASRRH